MSVTSAIEICPLREEFLPEVIRIHRQGLGYSAHSRLGYAHLALLYRTMEADPSSFVHVALADGKPVGSMTGTLDEDGLKRKMLRAMPPGQLLLTGVRLLVQPVVLFQILQGMVIDKPVYYQEVRIDAMLNSLAVDPGYEGRGVARSLFASAERFFLDHGQRAYHLATLADNHRALRLYEWLGFVLVYKRAGSVILLRTIGDSGS